MMLCSPSIYFPVPVRTQYWPPSFAAGSWPVFSIRSTTNRDTFKISVKSVTVRNAPCSDQIPTSVIVLLAIYAIPLSHTGLFISNTLQLLRISMCDLVPVNNLLWNILEYTFLLLQLLFQGSNFGFQILILPGTFTSVCGRKRYIILDYTQ